MLLANYYSQREKKQLQTENENGRIRFLLPKLHIFWQKGFLQAETMDEFDNARQDEEVSPDENTINQMPDFYDGNYLNGKPAGTGWLDYIYTVKLNEMLDIEKYEMVQVWEEAEHKQLLDTGNVFDPTEKGLAWNNVFGDYNLWCRMKKTYDTDFQISSICLDENYPIFEIPGNVIAEISKDSFRAAYIRKKVLEKDTDIKIHINYECNEQLGVLPIILFQVKEYILENRPDFFMNQMKTVYHISDDGDILYHYDKANDSWSEVDKVKAEMIEISKTRFSDEFLKKIKQVTNNEENNIRFHWWAYQNGKLLEEDYKNTLSVKMYKSALELLGDDFKNAYKKLIGFLPY
jgi:hypothetical protein